MYDSDINTNDLTNNFNATNAQIVSVRVRIVATHFTLRKDTIICT